MQTLLARAFLLAFAVPFVSVASETDQLAESAVRSVQNSKQEKSKKPSNRAARVIRVLGVREGQVIADIGCGSGWLSEAIAKKVGPDGTVFAVDVSKSSIDKVRERGIENVKPVLSKPDDVTLPEDILDTAFLHDVADHMKKSARPEFYASIARALKSNGRLFIFDPHGKAKRHLKELREYGFVPDTDEDLTQLSSAALDERLQVGIGFRHVASKRDPP